ncbi:ATP-dependent DNA helicase PIF1-like protein [Tanacetum coccineum]
MELMQQVELVIWDEAPMTQKYAFEALDKTLWDILGYPVPDKRNKIFGGMMTLLGGDFKQILPVIPKGKREDIVQACINRLELWKHCKVSTLKRSMRPARIKDGEDEPTWIEIPETFLIPSLDSPIQQIVEETYPNFIKRQKDDAYLREQAILTPRNDDADAINAYMFDKLASQAITYHSADELKWPLVLKRRQCPVRPCYAMTINKSQGQSLNYVGLYLPNPVFSHGQIYVALSRVTDPNGLKILMKEDSEKEHKNCTRNIVYKEAFDYLT